MNNAKNTNDTTEVQKQISITDSNSVQHEPYAQVHNGLDHQQMYDNMQQLHQNMSTQPGNTVPQHHQPQHNTSQHNNIGNHNNGHGMHH